MFTIILACIETFGKNEFCELYLGTVIIDITFIIAIVDIIKLFI